MRAFQFSRCALSISLAAALLAACGAPRQAQGDIPAIGATNGAGPLAHNKAFEYTGKEQTFVVPSGVKQLTVAARGAEGGGLYSYPSTNTPGFPGRVYAIIRVHPGERLYVVVGGSGTNGGFNGGAGQAIYTYGHNSGGDGGGLIGKSGGGSGSERRRGRHKSVKAVRAAPAGSAMAITVTTER